MFTYLEIIIVQVNYMTCLFVDTLSLTANAKMIVHRCPVQSEEVALQYFCGFKSISSEGISRDQ